jgi:hypothetical protein
LGESRASRFGHSIAFLDAGTERRRKKLTEEGLPADIAKKIVSDTIQDVKTKYFSKT